MEPEKQQAPDKIDALAQSSETSSLPPIADTYVTSGTPNTNHGAEAVLLVNSVGGARTLIHFDQGAIDEAKAAAGINVLESATLELSISTNEDNWGASGRTIDAHLLTQGWTELGATWNCANDTDIIYSETHNFWLFCNGDSRNVQTCGLETSFSSSTTVDRPSGPAFCWGEGEDGELGIGEVAAEQEEVDVPTRVLTVDSFVSISLAVRRTCGVHSSGNTYCWGDGDFTPQLEESTVDFVSIEIGDDFQCGITGDFLVYCWGQNGRGQLGQGDLLPRFTPALLATGAYRAISASRFHACAVTEIDGRVQCWGSNRDGQLGFVSGEVCGSVACSRLPRDIDSSARFVAVSTGEAHTCALANTGEVFCWGSNEFGQLGNGGGGGGPVPVRVNDPH